VTVVVVVAAVVAIFDERVYADHAIKVNQYSSWQ